MAGAAQTDGMHAFFLGGEQGRKHIGTFAGSGNSEEYVSRNAEGVNLFCKDLFKAEVVADRCEYGTVRSQGKGRQGRAIDQKAVHEFPGKMLSVRSASAIAADEQLMASAHGQGDAPCAIFQIFRLEGEKIPAQAQALLCVLGNDVPYFYVHRAFLASYA